MGKTYIRWSTSKLAHTIIQILIQFDVNRRVKYELSYLSKKRKNYYNRIYIYIYVKLYCKLIIW